MKLSIFVSTVVVPSLLLLLYVTTAKITFEPTPIRALPLVAVGQDSPVDCAGVVGGNAVYDCFGMCCGGTTGWVCNDTVGVTGYCKSSAHGVGYCFEPDGTFRLGWEMNRCGFCKDPKDKLGWRKGMDCAGICFGTNILRVVYNHTTQQCVAEKVCALTHGYEDPCNPKVDFWMRLEDIPPKPLWCTKRGRQILALREWKAWSKQMILHDIPKFGFWFIVFLPGFALMLPLRMAHTKDPEVLFLVCLGLGWTLILIAVVYNIIRSIRRIRNHPLVRMLFN